MSARLVAKVEHSKEGEGKQEKNRVSTLIQTGKDAIPKQSGTKKIQQEKKKKKKKT